MDGMEPVSIEQFEENLGCKWVRGNEVLSQEASQARKSSVLLFVNERNYNTCLLTGVIQS